MKKIRFSALLLASVLIFGSCSAGAGTDLPDEKVISADDTTIGDDYMKDTENKPARIINTAAATNLSAAFSADEAVNVIDPDDKFINAAANFSLELFGRSVKDAENTLTAPLSVMLALSMTANGANGETLSQMEEALGSGIGINMLNAYLLGYEKELTSDEKVKFNIANSIWINDLEAFNVKNSFLQKNANYYSADIYKKDFADTATVDEINSWCSDNTDGMIDNVINELSPDTMMALINALCFDAEWAAPYHENQIQERTFTNTDNSETKVDFMHDSVTGYIEGKDCTGFLRKYAGSKYAFAALLPNEDTTADQLAKTLDGKTFLSLMNGVSSERVITALPKFESSFSTSLVDTLKAMGIETAFTKNADFSEISDLPLEIGNVIHKTYINVDEKGTRAGAVTVVLAMATSARIEQPKQVILDRPFVYAIVDLDTGLPIFIGTLNTLAQ